MKIEEKHCFLDIDFNVFHCKVIGGWSASVFKRPHPEMMTLVPSGTSALAKAIGFILSVKVKGDCNFNRATSLKGLSYFSWTMSFSTCVTTPPSKRLMDPACTEKGLAARRVGCEADGWKPIAIICTGKTFPSTYYILCKLFYGVCNNYNNVVRTDPI
uniref:Uncharacterized protein n=1 Tax=Glossina pallidipes TaxID=7398 RepID=A0A1A9ZF64_GLOPL